MTAEEEIQKLTGWFFDRINTPVIEGLYIGDAMVWDTLCASLTNLNDLQRAKTEYAALGSVNHLEAIGIMQAIYIEQDCTFNLYAALFGTKIKPHESKYSAIRELRNQAFGHPSELGRKGVFSQHFFDITDRPRQLIKIINWECSGDINSAHISLQKIVADNSAITILYLKDAQTDFITKINQQMKAYQIQLGGLFSGASYTFSKLLTKENGRVVIDTYDSIEQDLAAAVTGLAERKLLDDYQRDIDVIRFLSARLQLLFGVQTHRDIEFYAYAVSLRRLIEEFRKSLAEIDPVLVK
ncbi:hypothetical protein [Mucilaginibacter sp.]|uniref:hypothetical protein n=1 Tax=Mucilaginibacter sp. TaxID=1882438 RepID=UPI003D0C8FA6